MPTMVTFPLKLHTSALLLTQGRIGAGGLTINKRQRKAYNLSCMKGSLPCIILMEGEIYFS